MVGRQEVWDVYMVIVLRSQLSLAHCLGLSAGVFGTYRTARETKQGVTTLKLRYNIGSIYRDQIHLTNIPDLHL